MRKRPWGFTREDFDLSFYQDLYPDIRKLKMKLWPFTYWHWRTHGKGEGRLHSKRTLTFGSRKKPSVGRDQFFPKALINYKFIDSYVLKEKPIRQHGALVILIPELQASLFFAGYRAFFSDMESIQGLFTKIYVVVFNSRLEENLLTNLRNATIITKSEFEEKPFEPDLVITFDTRTTLYSIENLHMATKTVYYCQDLEAGFHPFGSLYIWSLRALFLSQHLVISTEELHADLVERKLLSTESICVVHPKIDVFPIEKIPNKTIFAYFRPESYNSRNAAEHIWQGIQEFCRDQTGWKIYCVGTQGTNFAFELNGNQIYVTEKLSDIEYKKALGSAYICISFIYSSHPGVLAYQTAYSGIKTITNSFSARTEASLKQKSPSIVPIDLVRENLAQKLREEVLDFGERISTVPPQGDPNALRNFIEGVKKNASL